MKLIFNGKSLSDVVPQAALLLMYVNYAKPQIHRKMYTILYCRKLHPFSLCFIIDWKFFFTLIYFLVDFRFSKISVHITWLVICIKEVELKDLRNTKLHNKWQDKLLRIVRGALEIDNKFSSRQNKPICNPPLYIVVTFEPIMHLKLFLYSGCPKNYVKRTDS